MGCALDPITPLQAFVEESLRFKNLSLFLKACNFSFSTNFVGVFLVFGG